jgi:hypothetical protein
MPGRAPWAWLGEDKHVLVTRTLVTSADKDVRCIDVLF